jgi:heme-degrading monooxygenase HmoA
MFSVLFEVHPSSDQWDAYLANAKMLRPELESIDGFIDNIRYKSLTREGWILSLSTWRDEKALVRWRTRARHHEVQQKGRDEILLDYHLRVGQNTLDTKVPTGYELIEQRLDETEVGEGTTVTLVDVPKEAGLDPNTDAQTLATKLGLASDATGAGSWDVYDAVLSSGDLILMMSWKDNDAALAYESATAVPEQGRRRRVRVVRDYSMFDRREAPQFYAQATDRRESS